MKKTLICLLAISTYLPLFAQDFTVKIDYVSEMRSFDPNDAKLAIFLDYQDLKTNEYTLVKISQNYAIDNLGNRLERIGAPNFLLPSRSYASFEAPLREASSLQQIVMQIECFNPSLENGAIIRIPRFYENLGKNLLAPFDDYNDLNFVVVDSIGTEADVAKIMRKESLPTSTGSTFKPRPDQQWYSTYFLFDDPNGKIQKIEVLDAAGEAVEHINWDWISYGDSVRQRRIYFHTPIQKDWTLQLVMENEKALQEYTFTFYDVALH